MTCFFIVFSTTAGIVPGGGGSVGNGAGCWLIVSDETVETAEAPHANGKQQASLERRMFENQQSCGEEPDKEKQEALEFDQP
jgi:hypothetical protein